MGVQPAAVKARVERFDAQAGQQRVGGDRAGLVGVPQHRAEAARIVQPQDGVVENPVDVVVLARRLLLGHPAQRSGHAQVHDLHAMVEAQQQVFAAPPAFEHGAAGQQIGQGGWNGPAHARFAHDQAA
ncbi:Uncharacterised protein [Bordetella pertussis]|nr:Uncharacterised protein [Bordetella pertussis]